MTENVHLQPKALTPRKLEERETLQTLNHWKSVFCNYYRRCQFYNYFLQPGVNWSNETNHGFTEPETTGLKRSPETLAYDLEGFLTCLAGYLPFDYVSTKLVSQATCMRDTWQIIYEIYDADVCRTHYLDYASMEKKPEETYRNFFNRLVGFAQQHLPTERVSAEGVSSPPTGEVMSIGLLDSIAIHWLLAIDKRLINIVKTEFATQLKTYRLCHIIKQIAPNIDNLLSRYNTSDSVASVAKLSTCRQIDHAPDSHAVDNIIRRLERLESQRFSNNNKKKNQDKFREKKICSHCAYINKQLGCNLDDKHYLNECERRKISVNVIAQPQIYGHNSTDESSESAEGDMNLTSEIPNPVLLQTEHETGRVGRILNFENSNISKDILCNHKPELTAPPVSAIIDNIQQQSIYSENCQKTYLSKGTDSCFIKPNPTFLVNLRKLSSSNYYWGYISKSKSPRIAGCINDIFAPALIDSGAEINVLDALIARKAGIGIRSTNETATAATIKGLWSNYISS